MKIWLTAVALVSTFASCVKNSVENYARAQRLPKKLKCARLAHANLQPQTQNKRAKLRIGLPLAISTLVMALPAFGHTGTDALLQQIGSKLVGTGANAHAEQGNAVAISADGNTAIIGAFSDTAPGSASIFTNTQGVWTQQGAKLVGMGAIGTGSQGYSVAISADGNTVIIGGEADHSGVGAAWVFTRSAGTWTQQGSKLVGTGGSGRQGWSVAISGDGNTAIVGGPTDGGSIGAVWVFTRSGGVWTQQGSKLVGTGAVGASQQGDSVALSVDGNTAIVGGANDNPGSGGAVGATWVFTRSAGVWTQQGPKLLGTGAIGLASQGYSVGLSADGNTALIGGRADNGNIGAVWAFSRSGGVWSQQGSKFAPSDAAGAAQFGISVALSANANKAVVGGYTDNSANGAIWAFTRSGSVWSQQGSKLVVSDGAEPSLLGYSVSLSADGGNAIAGGLNDNNGAGAAWVFGSGTDFGALNIGAHETASIDIPWSANFVLGSIAVLAEGAAILDFTLPSQPEGSCELGFTYAPGESCPVTIQFSPTAPGLRSGAVLFYDNSAPPVLIATVFFNGIGLGPQAGFVSGLIATSAGTGVAGYTGDGGLATGATLHSPFGLAFDGANDLFIDQGPNCVVRVVNHGTLDIATVAGNGTCGFAGTGGPATSAQLGNVKGIAIDGSGNLYISDISNFVIWKVDRSSGAISIVAGTGTQGLSGDGGPATSAALGKPQGIAIDRSGNLYVVDDTNNVIREVGATTGIITTVVGVAGGGGYSGDGGSALSAEISFPLSPVLDAAGDLYFADDGNNVIREVSVLTGDITTMAGNGTRGFSGDGGLATSAELNDPEGLTLDSAGNLYITDSGNNALRKLSANTGIIATIGGIGGVGSSGYRGNGAAATQALLSYPVTPTLDGAGNIYLADEDNNVIREINGIAPLSFGTVTVGSTSSAQDVTLANNGTSALTLSSLTVSANFNLGGADTTCTASTSLNPGASCALGVQFAPTVTGPLTGSLGLIDTVGSQAVVLSGTGQVLTVTTTTLIASPNPATAGQTVTLTATISPVPSGSSLGTVSFYDGETLLGSGNVNSSGVAAFSTTSLPVGANSLTAVYSGNVAFAASTSSAIMQTVTSRTGTTTTLTASPNPVGSGGTVTFTATISPAPTGTPTGTVSFYSGSTLLGTATLNSSGVATFTSTSLATGALSITAVYSGNTGFAGSTSFAVVETVNSLFTVTGPPAPVAVQQGGSVVIDVTVPPLGGAFDKLVTMSVSGLPPGATATFSPPTVTPGSAGAPTVLTIQLAALAAGMVDLHRRIPFASFAFAIGLCGFGLRRKRFFRKCRQVLAFGVLAGAAFMLATMTACGGGFAGPPTTQSGSYLVTITGTSGSTQASTTVTVVVR